MERPTNTKLGAPILQILSFSNSFPQTHDYPCCINASKTVSVQLTVIIPQSESMKKIITDLVSSSYITSSSTTPAGFTI